MDLTRVIRDLEALERKSSDMITFGESLGDSIHALKGLACFAEFKVGDKVALINELKVEKGHGWYTHNPTFAAGAKATIQRILFYSRDLVKGQWEMLSAPYFRYHILFDYDLRESTSPEHAIRLTDEDKRGLFAFREDKLRHAKTNNPPESIVRIVQKIKCPPPTREERLEHIQKLDKFCSGEGI